MRVIVEGNMTRSCRSSIFKLGLPCLAIVVIIILYVIISTKQDLLYTSESVGLFDDLNYLRKNGITNNLSAVNLDNMDADQLLLTMHSYLDNTDVICQRKLRMGKVGDGGWEICDDPKVRPQQPCVIYSFGINYDFSFDDDAARLYGCHVYSFDPSMENMKTSDRSDHVHFYKIGLSGATLIAQNGWSLYTFSDLRSLLGHQNVTIDIIKMDIENWEWETIPQMISTEQLVSPRQFLLEYHVSSTEKSYLLPRLKAIQAVEKAGFRKFYVHKNEHCMTLLSHFPIERTECYEVHYLKG
uniref:Methyltransferase domain-containing protein n=1 Tax=Arion vulgaris TaxID=1028688 RepID=A0A0B6ZKQ3_9EUPU